MIRVVVPSNAAVASSPKLLDRVRWLLRAKHYSIRTEQAYVDWIRRFILFHQKRHPDEMGEEEITDCVGSILRQLLGTCVAVLGGWVAGIVGTAIVAFMGIGGAQRDAAFDATIFTSVFMWIYIVPVWVIVLVPLYLFCSALFAVVEAKCLHGFWRSRRSHIRCGLYRREL